MASVEDSDWRGEMTLLQRQKFMFTGKYGCDVTFIVGKSEEKIYAHKFVLICGSSVMEEKLRQHNGNAEQNITVENIQVDAFNQMIKYFYCEEVDLSGDTVLDILAAAKQFRVLSLVKMCTEYLKRNITVDNVLTILNKSTEHRADSVTDKCKAIVSAHARQLLYSDAMTELSTDAMKVILEQDELEGITEREVFDVVIKWATEKCKSEGRATSIEDKRDVLGDLLHHIRFASMTTSEFTKVMKTCKILSVSERAQMFEYIADEDEDEETRPPVGFTSKPRRHVAASVLETPSRFIEIKDYGWQCGSSPDAIDFIVSEDINIHGVGLYGGLEAGTYEVELSLLDEFQSILATTGEVYMVTDGSTEPHHVMFPLKVPICKENTYTLRAIIEGPQSFFGAEGKTIVEAEGVAFEFSESKLDVNATGVDGGQIPLVLYSLLH